jgi:uncharacterized protein (TIGR01777 family)
MRVLLTGGTGFIGAALTDALLASGSELTILSRSTQRDRPRCRFIRSLDQIAATEQFDAVINLAGASLAARRWSTAYKREIFASRMDTTRQVFDLLARLQHRPAVLLSASAIGYYGHHGDERLTESSATTPGFAQRLCSDWESLALQGRSSSACGSACCAWVSYWTLVAAHWQRWRNPFASVSPAGWAAATSG